jgi:hypothetical protein
MTPNPAPIDSRDLWLKRNSALWFDATPAGRMQWQRSWPQLPWKPWKAWPRYYSKVHLVPFSEYVPFKQSWPGLHRLLRGFVPEVMDQLEPGEEFCCYELDRAALPSPASQPQTQASAATQPQIVPQSQPGAAVAARSWRLATPICYEGTISRVCRNMVWQGGRKAVDILVNLSNDGWFIWQMGNERQHLSTEHAQHLAHYCFRAVENRVPVVRAVNTGISASIDSCGRLLAQVSRDSQRTMVKGTLLLDGRPAAAGESPQRGPLVLVDSRVSVYSRIGDAFAFSTALAAALMAIALGAMSRRERLEGA